MLVKAISTIIAFEGAMVVINAGETGELSDALAEREIGAGNAVEAKAKPKQQKPPKRQKHHN
jgi:hypothetical protein